MRGRPCIRPFRRQVRDKCRLQDALHKRLFSTLPPRLLGALALLRKPAELDGDGLGRAISAAAREGVKDAEWWEGISARAAELAPALALHEAIIALNGMARARQLYPPFLEAVVPRISAQLVYLTTAHLAMFASVLAKANYHDQLVIQALVAELKERVSEFHGMESTMVMNALSKLEVHDMELYSMFLEHIQATMGQENYHVRDLSVIAEALARVGYAEDKSMVRLMDCALESLFQAKMPELARLMHACICVGNSEHRLFAGIVEQTRNQIFTVDPPGLSAAAYSFGQCFEVATEAHARHLWSIFREIRTAFVVSLPLFLPREISSLIRTYARWQLTFDCDQLRQVAERLRDTSAAFASDICVATAYAVGQLAQRNLMSCSSQHWNVVTEAASAILAPVWIAGMKGRLNLSTLLRALEASVSLRVADPRIKAATAAVVVRSRSSLDASTRASLIEVLHLLGVSSNDDLVILLSDEGKAALALGDANATRKSPGDV